MATINEALRPLLASARRVAVLGVGAELRSDDFAGMAAAQALLPYADSERLLVCFGGAAPENCTGELRRFHPDVILVLDAAEMHLTPGEYALLDPSHITGATFCTHMLPLPVTLSYLEACCGCVTAYIGIQPASVAQGIGMCDAVAMGATRLAAGLSDALHLRAGD